MKKTPAHYKKYYMLGLAAFFAIFVGIALGFGGYNGDLDGELHIKVLSSHLMTRLLAFWLFVIYPLAMPAMIKPENYSLNATNLSFLAIIFSAFMIIVFPQFFTDEMLTLAGSEENLRTAVEYILYLSIAGGIMNGIYYLNKYLQKKKP